MKLSEALIQRAEAQRRYQHLRTRLTQNALVQEGDQPAEDPVDLLAELDHVLDEFTTLVRQINHTNSVTRFDGNWTLTDALAERDRLAWQRTALQGLVQAANYTQNRYSRSEVKFVSTVDVADLQRQVDDLSRQYRELDTAIQALNWSTDVIE